MPPGVATRQSTDGIAGSHDRTKRGVTVTWTVADSSRTRWVTEQVQYNSKRGQTKTLNYVTVIQCPD